MRFLPAVLALSWIACFAPTDDDPLAHDELAITGGTTSPGCTGCSIIGYQVGASTTVHTGIMVKPRLVLTSKHWLTATSSVQLTNAPNAVVGVVLHPTLDVALLRLGSDFSGFGQILPIDNRILSSVVGTPLQCYGWSATDTMLHTIATEITDRASSGYVIEDLGAGFVEPGPDAYADAGTPCVDPARWTIMGVTRFAVTDPILGTSAIQIGAERLIEWIDDQHHLTTVMRTRSPVAIYYVDAAGTRRCIDVADASIGNYAFINRFPCHGGLNQTWYLGASTLTGYTTLVSGQSGKCIDVPNGVTTPGTGLQQYTCTSGNQAQAWASSFYNPGIKFTVRSSHPNQASQLCLTATATSRINQATCVASAEQRWFQWNNPTPASHP